MNLEETYAKKHKIGLEKIKRENEFIDENLNNNNDTRRGIALLIRPSEEVLKNIQNKANELKKIDSSLYVYSKDCLHITLYSFIKQTEDFTYEHEQHELYSRISKEALSCFKSFKINCKGLMFTDKTVLVKGFPEDMMQQIKQKIRETLNRYNISNNEPYKDDMYHLSLARFKSRIVNREKLIKFVEENYNNDFGSFDVSEVELIYHDWYDTKREVLGKISLLNNI